MLYHDQMKVILGIWRWICIWICQIIHHITHWKIKIITTNTEKDLKKFNIYLGKNSSSEYRGKIVEYSKSHIWLVQSYHYIQSWKLKVFCLRLETKQGCSLLPVLFNIVLEVLATAIRQENVRNMNPNWKGRHKIVTVCRWRDSIYRKSWRRY